MKKVTIGVVIMLLCLSNGAFSDDTYWIGTTGDWYSPSNWMYKVPTSGDIAYIDNGGTAEINSGSAEAYISYLGYGSDTSGSVNQISGSLTTYLIVGHAFTGTGTYNLSGGQLTTSAYRQIIGNNGNGVFNQNDGTNINSDLTIGNGYTSSGIYNLTGGSNSSASIDLGYYDTAVGTFNQTDGTNNVSGSLTLGYLTGGEGIYNISGGSLSTQDMRVGYWGSGNFQIDNSMADISITNSLLFGTDSSFTAVTGSTINMDSASLDNWNTDQNDLLGFNLLNMVFDGGTSTFEVAGQDIGYTGGGFIGNFALDTLTIGDSSAGNVQLVNYRTNMGGTEALYANNCTLGAGSTLDLNGLNLYCENMTDYGGTINYNGGQLIAGQTTVVPEPISSTLFIVGGATLGFRRWRKR